jgi:hypothetical protein
MAKNETVKSEATASEPRITPEIDPKSVKTNESGQVWRSILVYMPEGMVADDLRDAKIWKRVQASPPVALRKLDHLLILTANEDQAIRAVVTYVTGTEAHLSIERVSTFREQSQSLFSDGTLEVFFENGAYSVRRMSDKVRVVNESFHTEALAISSLRQYYPKVA